jgi:nitrogen fixation protein
MANCGSVTLSAIDARCHTSFGGIKRVLVANRDEVEVVTTKDENGVITGITDITIAEGKKFVEWQFRKNTGSLTSTVTSDTAIGNTFATTEVTLQFTKAEATKRLAIQSAINASAVVIVEDMYGQYIYLGLENEVVVSAATMVTGTAAADLNGFTLTFQDIATQLPYFVEADMVKDLPIDNGQ